MSGWCVQFSIEWLVLSHEDHDPRRVGPASGGTA